MSASISSAGILPAADVDGWLADQRRSAEDGTFFAACNYYAYVARAPSDAALVVTA